MGETPLDTPELEEREDALVQRVARLRGLTPAELRAEARRRALQLEVQSMRRDR